jgi:hypothetical protein
MSKSDKQRNVKRYSTYFPKSINNLAQREGGPDIATDRSVPSRRQPRIYEFIIRVHPRAG